MISAENTFLLTVEDVYYPRVYHVIKNIIITEERGRGRIENSIHSIPSMNTETALRALMNQGVQLVEVLFQLRYYFSKFTKFLNLHNAFIS